MEEDQNNEDKLKREEDLKREDDRKREKDQKSKRGRSSEGGKSCKGERKRGGSEIMSKNCGTRKVVGGIGIIVQRSKEGKKKEEGEIMSG